MLEQEYYRVVPRANADMEYLLAQRAKKDAALVEAYTALTLEGADLDCDCHGEHYDCNALRAIKEALKP